MNQSPEIGELAKALAQAQAEMTPAAFDGVNPHYKSKYSKLPAVWDACRGPLSKNGLCVIQTLSEIDNRVFLTTTLAHSSGQWIRSVLPVISTKADNHGMASGITYARRNALAAIVGVVSDEDDDGNACVQYQNSVRSAQNTLPQARILPTETITEKQAEELVSDLEKCSDGFKKYVESKMKELKIDNLYKLPVFSYTSLTNAMQQELKRKVEK